MSVRRDHSNYSVESWSVTSSCAAGEPRMGRGVTAFLPLLIAHPSETCLSSWWGKYLLKYLLGGQLLSRSDSHGCGGTGVPGEREGLPGVSFQYNFNTSSSPHPPPARLPTFLTYAFPTCFPRICVKEGNVFEAFFCHLYYLNFFRFVLWKQQLPHIYLRNVVPQMICPTFYLLLSYNPSKRRGTFPSRGEAAGLPWDLAPPW